MYKISCAGSGAAAEVTCGDDVDNGLTVGDACGGAEGTAGLEQVSVEDGNGTVVFLAGGVFSLAPDVFGSESFFSFWEDAISICLFLTKNSSCFMIF